MRIGEKMSEFVDMANLLRTPDGDMYANSVDYVTKRPLPFGQLIYAKIRDEFPEQFGVEVWWNHFDNHIEAYVEKDGESYYSHLYDRTMPREERIRVANDMADSFLAEVYK